MHIHKCDICSATGYHEDFELLCSIDDDGPATLLVCEYCAGLIAEDPNLLYEKV